MYFPVKVICFAASVQASANEGLLGEFLSSLNLTPTPAVGGATSTPGAADLLMSLAEQTAEGAIAAKLNVNPTDVGIAANLAGTILANPSHINAANVASALVTSGAAAEAAQVAEAAVAQKLQVSPTDINQMVSTGTVPVDVQNSAEQAVANKLGVSQQTVEAGAVVGSAVAEEVLRLNHPDKQIENLFGKHHGGPFR